MATLKYVSQYFLTTLNVGGGIDASQTTGIVLQSVSGVTDITKPGQICVSYSDPIDTAIAEWIDYTSINGSNELQGVTRGREGFSAHTHLQNATVAFVVSASHFNDISTALAIGGVFTNGVTTTLDEDAMTSNSATALATQQSIKAYVDASAPIITITKYAPQGFLLNGQIVPSVASNHLTVAIKGMDGNNPSASNPVYVRIGNTVRTITSALSVTKNAGTNWCNAGSAELATKEIDYFVYLGYNATDGVVIGFSRIPYAGEYSEFSATTTDEKYCAISTITNAAAGDDYEVVGRFAATLSAGAGYTWSVPTFTNINLIQRPIYETRILYGTSVATGSGSMGIATDESRTYAYVVRGRNVHFVYFVSIGQFNGTPNNLYYSTLPFKALGGKFSPSVGGSFTYTPTVFVSVTTINNDNRLTCITTAANWGTGTSTGCWYAPDYAIY